MLTLYRRHRNTCGVKDPYWKRCKCPIWVEGTFSGAYIRKSLKLTSWERAQDVLRAWEEGLNPTIYLQEATEKFYADAVNRNLNPATLRKYRLLFKQILAFFGNRKLDSVTVEALRDFRVAWTESPRTCLKKLERLRSFFGFCQQAGWVQKNPAKALKPPIVKVNPTLPFTSSEVGRIMTACPDEETKAFVYLLRYSGLRISDAALLHESKLDGGHLFLHTHKTGSPVYIPLPEFLIGILRTLPKKSGYLFIRESTNPHIVPPQLEMERAFRR